MDQHNASMSRLALAVTALSLLSVTACQNTATPSSGTSSSAPEVSSAAAPSSSAAAPAPDTSSNPGSVASAARACTATDLNVALGPADAGAGQRHTTLDFRTVHGRTCVLTNNLTGYEFLRGDGTRLPTRVSPPRDPHAFIILRPGDVGHLDLTFSVINGRPFTPNLLKFIVPAGSGGADTVGWHAGPVGDNGRLRIGRLHF